MDMLLRIMKMIEGESIKWALCGSTSLAFQGVDVPVNDIDIFTDKNGSDRFHEILKRYCVQEPTLETATDVYRSYYGIYLVDGVDVDVCGEFQYKAKDGKWSQPLLFDDVVYKDYNGVKIPVLSLERELADYEAIGRTDKADAIRRALIK